MFYKLIFLFVIFILHYFGENEFSEYVEGRKYNRNDMESNKNWDEIYPHLSLDQSFKWGFLIMIAPFLYRGFIIHSLNFIMWLNGLALNIIFHYFIDRDNKERYSKLKTSKKILHIIQVLVTWVVYILI